MQGICDCTHIAQTHTLLKNTVFTKGNRTDPTYRLNCSLHTHTRNFVCHNHKLTIKCCRFHSIAFHYCRLMWNFSSCLLHDFGLYCALIHVSSQCENLNMEKCHKHIVDYARDTQNKRIQTVENSNKWNIDNNWIIDNTAWLSKWLQDNR